MRGTKFRWSVVVSLPLLLGGLLLAGRGANGVRAGGRPGEEGAKANPILVELFTSEGCSSCPPADVFVQKLDTLQPVAGAELIVLSEHVDYWDHDGWKDPNSSHALTERQTAYVRMLGLDAPYTPQIIVDGGREVKIGDPQAIEKVFEQAVSSPKVPVQVSGVAVDPGNPDLLHAHVNADAATAKHNADVFLAIALDHVESQVLHGENDGRHLTHVAVVQQIVKVGKLNKGSRFEEDVQLKLKTRTPLNNLRVVAFAQESGPGKLLGASLWKGARPSPNTATPTFLNHRRVDTAAQIFEVLLGRLRVADDDNSNIMLAIRGKAFRDPGTRCPRLQTPATPSSPRVTLFTSSRTSDSRPSLPRSNASFVTGSRSCQKTLSPDREASGVPRGL